MWPLRSWPEYLEKLLPSRNECYSIQKLHKTRYQNFQVFSMKQHSSIKYHLESEIW